MNFEEYFLPNDEQIAEKVLKGMFATLKLVDIYKTNGDKDNEKLAASWLMNDLSYLNELAIRKEESNQMFLHHLLNYPQRWYPV